METVLAMGHYNTEMILSIRTSSEEINAGELIRTLVDGIGSAGGHGMMAGGKVDNVEGSDEAIWAVEKLLSERLLSQLHIPPGVPLELVP
jgi:nanoRNase/pAp phosphatase (c-di-AMP/oligoRNAs hydrolase)